jgi:ABC-type nitrate/sulfonate/bicarbonate transport system substrate-binding protein
MKSARRSCQLLALLATAVLAAACGSQTPAPRGTGSARVDTARVVLGFGSPPDVGDLPVLVAVKRMQQKGYNISTRVFNGDPLLVTAALQGQAQLLNPAAVSVLNADLGGDKLEIVLENTANETELVADARFKKAADLKGATMALASPTSSTHTLALWTEQKYGSRFNFVYQGSSSVRSQALLAHRVDCSILEIDDVTRILQNDPAGFRALVDYSTQLPWLMASVWATRQAFARQHPGIVQEYVNQVIAAVGHAYKDPGYFVQQAPSLITGYQQDVVKRTMTESVSHRIWGNGDRVTSDDARRSLAFWTQTGTITATQSRQLQSLSWFDGSFVQKATSP